MHATVNNHQVLMAYWKSIEEEDVQMYTFKF
jgi:hypothetical protein